MHAPYASRSMRGIRRRRLHSHFRIVQAKMPVEATNPLQHMCGWDRTLSVTPRAKYSATVLAGYRTTLSENDTKTEIEWFPPGRGLTDADPGACPWHANISGDFEYQVYIHDITDYVGTSGVEYNLYKVSKAADAPDACQFVATMFDSMSRRRKGKWWTGRIRLAILRTWSGRPTARPSRRTGKASAPSQHAVSALSSFPSAPRSS